MTLGEDASILETPAIGKYDLIVANADRRDPEFKYTKAQQQALLDYVRSGHGYVSIHGANNAAPDWLPEWREMLGGVFSHVGLPDSKVRKGSYIVTIVDTASPITQGLARLSRSRTSSTTTSRCVPGVEPLATVEYDGNDLAGRLDPHLRQGPGLPSRASATATSVPARTTPSATRTWAA